MTGLHHWKSEVVSETNIPFDNLYQLLRRVGFEECTSGSHHIFRKQDVEKKISLQRDGTKAKAYQVGQVRIITLKYKLGGKE